MPYVPIQYLSRSELHRRMGPGCSHLYAGVESGFTTYIDGDVQLALEGTKPRREEMDAERAKRLAQRAAPAERSSTRPRTLDELRQAVKDAEAKHDAASARGQRTRHLEAACEEAEEALREAEAREQHTRTPVSKASPQVDLRSRERDDGEAFLAEMAKMSRTSHATDDMALTDAVLRELGVFDVSETTRAPTPDPEDTDGEVERALADFAHIGREARDPEARALDHLFTYTPDPIDPGSLPREKVESLR